MMNEETEKKTEMINFIIDGHTLRVPKGTTVYQAAQQQGIPLPIFCYQDRMPPFGACRVCLVEVEKMAKLQTSCTLEATEGMVVKTQSQAAEEGRKGILEFLLINHPLDCPICDRGGECPLQENALKYGPGISRFFEEKRRFKKPLPMGPVLMLDRERCIVCARCTRFGDLVAGDHALEMIDRGYKTEVGTPNGEPVDSKFIGNTIQICPVGALTSQVYRFRARPWDNDSTPTTCTLCPVGCSMILDARDGEIMRTRAQENRDVNDMWLCDKGWFGYEFTGHPDRLTTPLIRRQGKLVPISWEEAFSYMGERFWEAKPHGKLAGWGGNPLTVEENYLFQQLIRKGGEVSHVDHRIGMPIFPFEEEGMPPGMEMTFGESESLDYAVLFGLDITEEFPLLWLRLKQALNRGAKVFFIGHYAPEISKHLTATHLHPPGQELSTLEKHLPLLSEEMQKGKKGAFFVGRQYLQNPLRTVILEELWKWRKEAPHLTLNILEGNGNSQGARFAGMHPALGPMGERMNSPGLSADQVLEQAAASGWDFLYVAGANPAKKFPSSLWKAARSKTKFLVVQDLFLTETAMEADMVLPTLSYVEKYGHFMNIEGRMQKLQPGKSLPKDIYSDGDIFRLFAQKLNLPLALDPLFIQVLHNPFKKSVSSFSSVAAPSSPPKQNQLLATFAPALFDQGVRMKHNPHLGQLAKEAFSRIHPREAVKRNIQDNSVVTIKTLQGSIRSPIKWDSRVAEGTLVIPLGFDEIPAHELAMHLRNGVEVQID